MKFFLFILVAIFSCAVSLFADSLDVYVVANAKSDDSKAIAKYYARARGIAESNIIEISVPDKEALSRVEYQTTLANPLIAELIKRGLVSASEISKDPDTQRPSYLYVSQKVKFLVLCKMPFKIRDSKNIKASAASVDSELAATFLPINSLSGFIRNPLYKSYNSPELYKTCGVLRVARLDGKDFDEAKAIIDSSLLAERNGVRGRVYIDKNQKKGGYKIGNDWITNAENVLKKMNFDVSVDVLSVIMEHDKRFDAPLFYFGWYSPKLKSYFIEKPVKAPAGAVGLHIYSYSASDLRKFGWTANFMNRNFAQTYGNVYEPYLSGTQNMGALMEAFASRMSAGEAAYASIPVLSWRSLVVGDPLYEPFKISLEEQLKRINAGVIDELSQYVVIRQMNKMKSEGADVRSRLDFARTYVDSMPNVALKWKIIELLEELKNNKVIRIALLDLYADKIWQNPDYIGLSVMLAIKLSAYNRFSESMDIYNSLGELEMSDDFYRTILKRATRLSDAKKIPLSNKLANLRKKYEAQDAEKKK